MHLSAPRNAIRVPRGAGLDRCALARAIIHNMSCVHVRACIYMYQYHIRTCQFYRMARTNSRGDQANLFYVVWPEEEAVTTLSAVGALDPTLCSPQVHRSATTHRHQQTLQSHDRREQVGSFASPLTSPVVMRTSPAVQTSPKDPGRTISTNGQVERDNIIGELSLSERPISANRQRAVALALVSSIP